MKILLALSPEELHSLKTAVGYALTNPYNAPSVERKLSSCREKIAEALKTANVLADDRKEQK